MLVIEADGYHQHQEDSRQKERDKIKDRILKLYGIPYKRLSTTESNEQERIETNLKRFYISITSYRKNNFIQRTQQQRSKTI